MMTKLLGCLIIDLKGHFLSKEECELLTHPLVGGVILFSRNYESRLQLRELCQQIRICCAKPLLIMVDQEGGRVQRFVKEFTRLPPLSEFGRIYHSNPAVACQLAENTGWLMATELLAEGVDLSLAPVLDLNKDLNNVIGDRAFHSDPNIVIDLAKAFIRGMNDAGMAATGKHFPGHGSVTLDSHVALPIDGRSLEEIESQDIHPFAGLINSGLQAIMAAHIVFPKIDDLPVGFSSRWLQDILRKRLGFSGVIMSDDLNMAGANISKNFVDRVVASRKAGCDLVMLCNNRRAVIQVLDHLPYEDQMLVQEKWLPLQGKALFQDKTFQQKERWRETHQSLDNIIQQTYCRLYE